MIDKQAASRPINLHLRPKPARSPAVYDRLDRIQEEVENAAKKRRARDSNREVNFRSCLQALCLDLDAAYQIDPKLLIGVRRERNAFSDNAAYPDFAPFRPFIDALDGLLATGHIEHISKGTKGSGKSTRVRGTSKLRECLRIGERNTPDREDHSNLIRLKLGKKGAKERVRVVENDQTLEWRQNLERINQMNAGYSIGISLSSSDWAQVEAARRVKTVHKAKGEHTPFEYERVNLTKTRLYRSFSSRDWKLGGRFNGGWWQSIPKQIRRYITINDKATCEHDFSVMHMRLLYAKVGVPVPSPVSPYDLPYGENCRKAVKDAFNVMLNAKGKPKQVTVPEFSPEQCI